MSDATTSAVRALAPAKINTWLEVLGRREDGYHELETWMLAVDVCDVVEARANDSGELRLSLRGAFASSDIRCDETNLAWRAARAALDAGAERVRGRGVDLVLIKNIPSQAGLGGASADAAATWAAVDRALELELSNSVASAALARMGSDCVFFAEANRTGLAWCEGRGERVTSHAAPSASWSVALLTPAVLCPTASVYAAYRKHLSVVRPPHSLPPAWPDMPASTVRRFFFNALEAVALQAIPALVPWRRLLDACDAEHFRLSGSGSSFFGLFDKSDEAQLQLDRILAEAQRRGLAVRASWITRPAGFGAVLERDRNSSSC